MPNLLPIVKQPIKAGDITMTTMQNESSGRSRHFSLRIWCLCALILSIVVFGTPAFAQQSGDISGSVTGQSEGAVEGVSITASSNVLPQPRSTTTAANGQYRLRLLPPGEYRLIYTFADGSTTTRTAEVLLQQETIVDIVVGDAAELEEIVVTASRASVDTGQGALKNAISAVTIESLPVGQDYRDLVKLIPGVQYSEDEVRGPSAGGSGQDNGFQFDGVDVSLPLFGTLSAEPSSHDIEQFSVVRGGAKAIGFNRSGGFLMNTISKSGTNEIHGEISHQIQTSGMTGGRDDDDSAVEFDEDRDWTTLSLGGPIIRDRLFFYGSYYRPTSDRANVSNAYGEVGDFNDTRDEFFGKLTYAPSDTILINASYRTSDHEISGRGVGEFEAGTTSVGDDASLDIAIVEGSWILDADSSVSFKFTDFQNDNASRPDTLFDFPISTGSSLDVNNLDQQGLFVVPTPRDGEDAYNAFIQPLINQYGYLDNGVPTGGGNVGGSSTIDDQDFSRTSFEIAYDRLFDIGGLTHDVHFGYQYQSLQEDLARSSNGWGVITVPGGRTTATDGVTPIFYEARVNQMSLVDQAGGSVIPSINSKVEMQSFEINDSIDRGDWTYNLGFVISNDVLFGQGLREDPNSVSGFEVAPGNRYEMYEVDWGDMIQPRAGATWRYSENSSVYMNFARYHPSASSLARAASWDRNLRRTIDVAFDADGNFIEIDPVRSSSGKVFQDGLEPRRIDEYLIGWTSDYSSNLTLRAHTRYRRGSNFWEDTNNDARIRFEPPEGIPQDLYVPNLDEIRDEIGGSSYVIAELDGAFTKYWEASLEADWTHDNWFVSGSYVWSHYYGNFDQDNSTVANDANTFIGSSFIADGAGRQLWNFREGNLRGDRRHQLKIYGAYTFNWPGRAGAYLVYQSGQPWETWNVEVYRDLTGSSSDTSRFAEPAGSNTTSSHWQLDLNYTHDIQVYNDYNVQLRADLFNVFDNQTGYNIQNRFNSSGFGDPRSFFNPRRLQFAVKFQF